MNKSFFKVVLLTTILALLLIAVPMQLAQAAGEPTAPSLLEAQASYPGDLAISLTWNDNSFDETGFEIERCIGAGCTDFVLSTRRGTPASTDPGSMILGSLRSPPTRIESGR